MSKLGERLIEIHRALDAAGLPHAFGGAIALAYCTEEPRGTRDLDVNVFVPPARATEVLGALPRAVRVEDVDRRRATREGQVRVFWDETPVDVFLNTHDLHEEAARVTEVVPFEDTEIPVLGCESLLVFKALYNRTRDWADIEAMLTTGIDGSGALARLRTMLGARHEIARRLQKTLEATEAS